MSIEQFNDYLDQLYAYWNGENDDFVPIPIPQEVDEEMQRDRFY